MQQPFRPLEGIKVVDISHVIAGPFATFHLAQMGADVLKIEAPNGGDVMRRGVRGAEAFVALNAGKRSTVVDFKDPAGREGILALVRDSDVFVDNLRPGVLDGAGLGFVELRKVNPRIVYCAISGFGRAAGSGRPAYDHVVQAATGMTLICGNEGDPPIKIGSPIIDAAAGIVAALAIVSALRERDRTGTGLLVDVSMAGAALHLMYPQACEALTHGRVPARAGNQAFSGSPAADLFPTRDGRWMALGANTPRQFLALLGVLGLSTLATDPAIFDPPLDADAPAAFLRAKDPAAVKAALAAAVAARDAAELEAQLAAARVPGAWVRNLAEFSQEAAESGMIAPLALVGEGVEITSPGIGFQVVR